MSSMTLKQFMTRGMEKKADGFARPRAGGSWRIYKGEAVPENCVGLDEVINDAADTYTSSGAINPLDLICDTKKALNDGITSFFQHPDASIYTNELERFVSDNLPGLLNGNGRESMLLLDALKKSKIAPLLGELPDTKNPKACQLFIRTKVLNNINPALLNMAAENPELAKRFGMRPFLSMLLKSFGIDSKEFDNLFPHVKDYDMTQHIPGMAAYFGIPLAVGTLMGKPGWGLMLGMLGAGGYGYYQYNKMRGRANPNSPNYVPPVKVPYYNRNTTPTTAIPAPEEVPEAPVVGSPEASAPISSPSPGTSSISGSEEISNVPEEIDISDIGLEESTEGSSDPTTTTIEGTPVPVSDTTPATPAPSTPAPTTESPAPSESPSTPAPTTESPAPSESPSTPAPTTSFTPGGIPKFVPGGFNNVKQYA